MSSTEVIIHDEKDNVGVVVIEKIKPNQECNCWIMENDKSAKIQSISEIPLGHKIAMTDLKEGDTILKYGHDIGKVVKNIKKGEELSYDYGFSFDQDYKNYPCRCKSKNCCGFIIRKGSRWRIKKKKKQK